ncbi:unnamed protein product [Phaeothamnion confervicola]
MSLPSRSCSDTSFPWRAARSSFSAASAVCGERHYGATLGSGLLLRIHASIPLSCQWPASPEPWTAPASSSMKTWSRAATQSIDGVAALQWMVDNVRQRPDVPEGSGAADLCFNAAHAGRLPNLQCARANGLPWDIVTCWGVASEVRFEVLRWTRASGCPWNLAMSFTVALSGHVKTLRWARANTCPRGEKIVRDSAMAGNVEILQIHMEHDCPGRNKRCAQQHSAESSKCSSGRGPTASGGL